MSWLTLNEFKTITGINIDDSIVEEAITSATREIIVKLFTSQLYQYGSATSVHWLYSPIADSDADGTITTSDIDIWEEDTLYNEYELVSHVTSIENRRRKSVVTLDSAYPTAERVLFIDYKTSRDDIADMLPQLKELVKFLAIDYLFTNVPFSELQSGISQWTLNGVSIQFDNDAMIKTKAQNKIREQQLWNMLRAVRADGIAPSRNYHSDIDMRRHGIMFK